MTKFLVSPDNTFGFLTSLVDIHFPGTTGATGPPQPSYEGYYVYPYVQPQIIGVPKGFQVNPDGSSEFLGYTINYNLPYVGFPTVNIAFDLGFASGPFTAGFAATVVVALNSFSNACVAVVGGFQAFSSGPAEPYVPPDWTYGPNYIVPPSITASQYPPGFFFNYDGTPIISGIPDAFDDAIINGSSGRWSGGLIPGLLPQYTVGGPVKYQGNPPYNGN